MTGIAIVGAGTTKSASGTYEMTADTIAGCSCPLFCTCYLRIRPSLKNLQYWFSNSNDGFVLAYSKHRFDGADGNPKYSWDKRNGFTIAWTAKGDVAPQKKVSKSTEPRSHRSARATARLRFEAAGYNRRGGTMTPDDIAPEFRSSPKDYTKPPAIEGVRVLRLTRFTDDRGFFLEIFRAKANHPQSRELAEFFMGVPVAQMNFSVVDAEGHIKGLHYHLHQDDIWFVPPPSKAKFVLFDVRNTSPTFGKTQVIVAGGGQDLLVRIPAGVAHGYRPLTNPCALLYFVTETFDPAAPDELRIPWDHPAVKSLWDVPNG